MAATRTWVPVLVVLSLSSLGAQAPAAPAVSMTPARATQYLAVAESSTAARAPEDRAAWQRRINAVRDTLDVTLAWFAAQNRGEESMRVLIAIDRFWSDMPDLVRQYDRAFAIPGGKAATATRARALYLAARDAHRVADQGRVRLWANESIAISRQLADTAGMGRAYTRLVFAALRDGNHAALRALADTGDAFCVNRDKPCHAEFLNMRGESARVLLQYDSATMYYELANGVAAPGLGRIHNMGFALLGLGRTDAARGQFTDGLRRAVAIQDRLYCAFLLAGLASVDAAEHKGGDAAQLVGVSDAILLQLGAKADPADAVEYERYRQRARTELGPKPFSDAVLRGSKLPADSVMAARVK